MFCGNLHGYQEQAVSAAVERRSMLIAHGMGTGKTLVALAVIEELFMRGEVDSALIIVPAALRWQWAEKIAAFADVRTRGIRLKNVTLRVPAAEHCAVIDAAPAKRAELYAAMQRDGRPDYVIVSYETACADAGALRRLAFEGIVLDEAQAIKNAGAQRTKKIKDLTAPYRYALTGTPMDNGRPEEIYSVMQWVDPSVFGRWDLYDRAYVVRNEYGRPVAYRNLDVMHDTLAPAMHRRTVHDPDVAACMPAVVHRTVPVHLGVHTRAVYARIERDLEHALERARDEGRAHVDVAALYAGGAQHGSAALGRVSACMLAARLLLCDPRLLHVSAAKHRSAGKGKGKGIGSAYARKLVDAGAIPEQAGGEKLDVLLQLVDAALVEPSHKVVVFTAFREMLPLLQEALGAYQSVLYHGELDAAARAAAVARFCTSFTCRVFLSTDAGGSGVDLPVASHVINYDAPGGVGAWMQRCTRHTRASSVHRTVHVDDMVTVHSIEEHVHARMLGAQQVMLASVDDRAHKRTHKRGSLTAHLHASRTPAWGRTGE